MQHILSLSYGKDSLSCLGAIDKLGWSLDRAVTAINDLLARTEAAEARVEKAERERDAAIKMLRKIEWCNGCKNFRGLQGCRIGALVTCNPQNDMYVFGEWEE